MAHIVLYKGRVNLSLALKEVKVKDNRSNNGNIVVMPTTRRSGTDSRPQNLDDNTKELLVRMKQYEEIETISNRLSDYATTTGHELQKLKFASETQELDMVQRVAETLARLAADVGATGMLRICYQVLIAARHGQFEVISGLQSALDDEFHRFKSTLQLAT